MGLGEVVCDTHGREVAEGQTKAVVAAAEVAEDSGATSILRTEVGIGAKRGKE